MLRAEADFPHAGSWAIIQEGGRPLAARIISREGDDARISIAGREGASARQKVPLCSLANATALTDAEEAELASLREQIAGGGAGRLRRRSIQDKTRRHAELKGRQERARQLEQILAGLLDHMVGAEDAEAA